MWPPPPTSSQMAAWMEVPKTNAQDSSSLLYSLLRAAQQHPHHTLPIALALAHTMEDEKQMAGGTSTFGHWVICVPAAFLRCGSRF